MGQVVTDELVHEVGHGRVALPVAGLHHGVADVLSLIHISRESTVSSLSDR